MIHSNYIHHAFLVWVYDASNSLRSSLTPANTFLLLLHSKTSLAYLYLTSYLSSKAWYFPRFCLKSFKILVSILQNSKHTFNLLMTISSFYKDLSYIFPDFVSSQYSKCIFNLFRQYIPFNKTVSLIFPDFLYNLLRCLQYSKTVANCVIHLS